MFDNRPTRNQFGANNTRDTETFSDQFVEDRTKVHEYNNDFDEYNVGNYTITTSNGGAATAIAGDGGILQLTTGAASTNFTELQNIRATYLYQLGFRVFSEFLFSVDSALANLVVGMLNTTATPFTGASQTDGVYLTTAGTTAVNVNLAVGGVITTQAAVALLNPGLANQITFKTVWDGAIYSALTGRVFWELSGAGIVTPVRGEFLPVPVNYPGATLVNTTVAVQASTAAVRTLNLDLFSVIKDRQNPNATPVF